MLGGIAAAIVGGPLLGSLKDLAVAVGVLGLALVGTPLGEFALAAGALAVAGVAVYENWGKVSAFFKEFFPGFSKDVAQMVEGLSALVGWTKDLAGATMDWVDAYDKANALSDREHPGQHTPTFWESAKMGVGIVPEWAQQDAAAFGRQHAFPGVEDARPRSAAAGAGASTIKVEFNNTPRGTRVTTEGKPVDLDVGHSMLGT